MTEAPTDARGTASMGIAASTLAAHVALSHVPLAKARREVVDELRVASGVLAISRGT